MKNKHIIEILENSPLPALSDSDLATITSHAKECESCERAYQAARLSAIILSERVSVPVEPSPFFQTRVLAAWREKQSIENVPAWSRLWKSTRALVSSMALTTAALGVLSFFAPGVPSAGEDTASAYSAEAVLMDQQSDDQMSYEQVLSTIYNDENDDDVR
ncbi:MAG TPA: hypothetical protein VFD63_20760 [Pyrinomonadaceae bacterium]|nr:hypothetical protein [Pyrinomonadaceae bacterium]